MIEKAFLLTDESELSDVGRLDRALEFFGVTASRLSVPEFVAAIDTGDAESKSRILCTGAVFMKVLAALESKVDGISFWKKKIHSAFIYAGGDVSSLEEAAGRIAGDALVLAPTSAMAEWKVTEGFPEFCKSMSGVRVLAKSSGLELGFTVDETKSDTVSLISSGSRATFVRVVYQTVPIFLSTAGSMIDIRARLTGSDFDVRQNFFSAVPLVLYVKWAFAQTCWQSPESGACLVIDDPLLKPRYGFLKFKPLLDLMRKSKFSTNIAFIPWNWRRSSAKVVQLFRENPDQFSLSIHGCDHTGGEFSSANGGLLARKSGESLRRMGLHQLRTGLPHDAVMVFPQGAFSEQAMEALKRSNFIGVVNSDVVSTDQNPMPISIEDYWDVAVMNYSDFPIFTRRYPSAGVENFAFDILLGKPCLVVVHHYDCHDNCRHIAEFMDRLNQLNVPLHWTGLAEVLRRSFRQRELSPGIVEIEMYGSEVRIKNPSDRRCVFRFRKRESVVERIKAVQADGQAVSWAFREDTQDFIFEVELKPCEDKTVTVTFQECVLASQLAGDTLLYKLKALLRRYLSELRDNYVTRKPSSN